MNTRQFLEVARKVKARRARARQSEHALAPYATHPERIYTPADGPPPPGTYSPPAPYNRVSGDGHSDGEG